MLKCYVRQGRIVDKAHKITSIRQSSCLEKYIGSHFIERNMAQDDLEKDFYQLFSKSIFGETIENVGS